MPESFMTVSLIVLVGIVMFVFPLMTMADRADDVSQLTVETATTDFADEIRSTGKITPEEYNSFVQTINSTGNLYDVEIQVMVLDENPGKKTVQVEREKIGENVYYSVYLTNIRCYCT